MAFFTSDPAAPAAHQNALLDALANYADGTTTITGGAGGIQVPADDRWTILNTGGGDNQYVSGGNATTDVQLWLQGPDDSPGNGIDNMQAVLGFRTYNSGGTIFGIECKVADAYDQTLDFENQLNGSPSTFFNLQNANMDYWFYVTARRIIMVAHANPNYMSYYGGFMLPFARNDDDGVIREHPFPYYLGASYHIQAVPGVDNAGNRSMCDPGFGAARYRVRGTNLYRNVYNHQNVEAGDVDYHHDAVPFMWPYRSLNSSIQISSNSPDASEFYNDDFFNNMRPNDEGERALWECTLYDTEDRELVGILDGVFAIGGRGSPDLTPEQIVAIGGTDYRAFININRSNGRDWFCVRED